MRRFVIAVVVFAAFVSTPALAVTRNWTGLGGNANWSTPGNWNPVGAPVAGDAIAAPLGGPLNMVNDLPLTILSVVGLDDAYVVSGNAIHVSSGINATQATFNAPILSEGNDVHVTAAHFAQLNPNGHRMVWHFGTIGEITGTGDFSPAGSLPPMTLTGTHSFSGTVFTGDILVQATTIVLANASLPNATFWIGRGLEGYGQVGAFQGAGYVKPSTDADPIGTIAMASLAFSGHHLPEMIGEYYVDIAGDNSNDMLNVAGSVSLGGRPLTVELLNGYSPATGTSWVIVNNDGTDAVEGLFHVRTNGFSTGTPVWEGQKFEAAGRVFRISYVGGTGNDVVLTADVGPITFATSTTVDPSATIANAGEPISIGASISAPAGTIGGTVTFFDDATPLATVPVQAAGANTTQTFGPGSHSITARYDGTATHDSSTSAPKVIFMKTPTAISATAMLAGCKLSVSGHVTSTIGSATPSGAMKVRNGSEVLGTVSLDGSGNASLQIAAPSLVHAIRVDFFGNTEFAHSTTTANLIIADQPHPIVSIDDATASEDAGSISTTVELLPAPCHPTSVHYATSNGSAIAGEDYDAMSGTIEFAQGQSLRTIEVGLHADTDSESDETFTIQISGGGGAHVIRGATLTIANDDEPFLLFSDLQYGSVSNASGVAASSSSPLLLDLRIPTQGDGPFPLVVVIDAVRWSAPNHHSAIADFLPQHGYAVATIAFRPVSMGVFPAQLDDVRTALAWLRSNAIRYGLNTQRLAIFGSGRAGGNLAALAAVSDSPGLGIDAAIVGRAATDLVAIDANNCDGENDVTAFLGCTPSSCITTATEASPSTHASRGDGPFLILETSEDCNQSQLLANALHTANVEATLRNVPSGGHAPDWSTSEVQTTVLQFLEAKLLQEQRGRSRAVKH